jgi:hypothetical protein
MSTTKLTDIPFDVLLHILWFLIDYYDRLAFDDVLYGALGGRDGSHFDLATKKWRVATGGPGSVGPAVPADLRWLSRDDAPLHVVLSCVDAASDDDAVAMWRACLRWAGVGPNDPLRPATMPDDYVIDLYGSFARSPSFNRAVAAAVYADLADRAARAASAGDIAVGAVDPVSISQAFDSVCARGALDVARWLADNFDFPRGDALFTACELGRLDVVRYLVKLFGRDTIPYDAVVAAVAAACASGNLALMHYLACVVGGFGFPVEVAALSGNPRAVRWAVRRQLAAEDRSRPGHVDYERPDNVPCPDCEDIEREHEDIFYRVCRLGVPDDILYLRRAYKLTGYVVVTAFDGLCLDGFATAAKRLAAAAREVTDDDKYLTYLRVFALPRLNDGHRAVLAWLGEGVATVHRRRRAAGCYDPELTRALAAGPARAQYLECKLGIASA